MFTIQNYEIHEDLFYCPEDHFWLRVEHNRAQIGMDPLVQESMGAFVVVQLDEQGKIFKKGDYYVPIDQPGIRYLLETLEPEAKDSFFNWNIFDIIMQQKEGFSPYVFEDLALEILNQGVD